MVTPKLSRIGLALFSAFTLTMAIAPNAFAQRAQYLGESRLSARENDLDVFKVPRCQLPPVRDMKLVSLGGAVEIQLLVVQYRNGELDRLPVRSRIGKGGETRWISLKGNLRCITGIAIVGSAVNPRDRAVIQYYAR